MPKNAKQTKPKKPKSRDPFPPNSWRRGWATDEPAGWDPSKASLAIFRIDAFISDATPITLDDGSIYQLTEQGLKALRSSQGRRGLGVPVLPARDSAPPAASGNKGLFQSLYEPAYSPFKRWDDFDENPLPWVLEVPIQSANFDDAAKYSDYIRRRVESALRLLGWEILLIYGPTLYQPDIPNSLTGEFWLRPSHVPSIPAELQCHFDEKTSKVFQATYRALNKVKDDSFRIALRRFNLSHDRDYPEDGLIDSWVGLEALFSESAGDIRYKASIRVAHFIQPEPTKRDELFQALQRSYTSRNNLVHGKNELDNAIDARRSARAALRGSLGRILDLGRVPTHPELDRTVATGEWIV